MTSLEACYRGAVAALREGRHEDARLALAIAREELDVLDDAVTAAASKAHANAMLDAVKP